MESEKLPSPLATYLDYCNKGQLAYQYCPDDRTVIFFPRVVSPASGSTNLEWRISGGLGTVYAVTTAYRKDEQPYNVSIVDVDEGFRMMTRVEEVPHDQVRIGMRVRVRMTKDRNQQSYPVFVPAGEAK
ncbi:MAG: OB-fold domain-containing protein [Burkholderiales bacterium]|nr:OB-fold domain-containing protein [Burkholderiales bacterium]